MIPSPPIAVDAHCRTHVCWEHVHLRRRRRWIHRNAWRFARAHLSGAVKAMLWALGPGCETKGKGAAGYTLHTDDSGGPHRGRYQYLDGTWDRTVATLPHWLKSHVTPGPAYSASPAEQDVRTGYFYPSHRSEWSCGA